MKVILSAIIMPGICVYKNVRICWSGVLVLKYIPNCTMSEILNTKVNVIFKNKLTNLKNWKYENPIRTHS